MVPSTKVLVGNSNIKPTRENNMKDWSDVKATIAPSPKSAVYLHVKLASELKAQVKAIADGYGLSVSAYTRLALSRSIDEHRQR